MTRKKPEFFVEPRRTQALIEHEAVFDDLELWILKTGEVEQSAESVSRTLVGNAGRHQYMGAVLDRMARKGLLSLQPPRPRWPRSWVITEEGRRVRQTITRPITKDIVLGKLPPPQKKKEEKDEIPAPLA